MTAVDSIDAVHTKASSLQPIPAPYFRRGDDGDWLIATADSLTEGDIVRVTKKDNGSVLVLVTNVLGIIPTTGVTEATFTHLARWHKEDEEWVLSAPVELVEICGRRGLPPTLPVEKKDGSIQWQQAIPEQDVDEYGYVVCRSVDSNPTLGEGTPVA